MVPTGYIDQEQIAKAVERATQKLGPEVVRVRYSIRPDTSDEPAIYFRIVLTEQASRFETLGDVSGKITRFFFEELHSIENWGLYPYFRFRSESEQAARDDPAWA